ncbi:LysR family transcriptional regulator [Streptomyces sp. p1417]|uniref:LysR family transcriptional regulator n=1 Tax=Streptomyces typhae TaxID=2681492 RepID=A0A6L6X934_9ACTN|nr:LysR family transcriptional regulator [Streptomyces typhae]MVO90364.1 LysR family transcriptional regulator [Streptomyces typhae]
MGLELRQLRVVRAIADRGSLSAAARELGLAQPSVTQSLAQAERGAGGLLFQRGSRGAEPTELGTVVIEHARTVLDAVERMAAACTRHREDAWPAVVRMGCAPGLLVAQLSVAVPLVAGTDVQITVAAGTEGHLRALAEGRTEAALVTHFHPPGVDPVPVGVGGGGAPRGEASDAHGVERRGAPRGETRGALCGAVVAVEPLFAALSANHPLASWQEVRLADLAGERWCLPPGPDDLGAHLTAAGRASGHTLALSVADGASALALVRERRAVLPVMPGIRDVPGVVLRPLRGEPLAMTTALYWRPDGPLSEEWVRSLWGRLVHAQRDIVESTPAYRAWLTAHPDWRTVPSAPTVTHRPRA